MKKVSGPQVVTPAEALERPLPAADSGGARGAGRRGEGGIARAERRRRAERGARVDGGRGLSRWSGRRAGTTRTGWPSATGMSAGR